MTTGATNRVGKTETYTEAEMGIGPNEKIVKRRYRRSKYWQSRETENERARRNGWPEHPLFELVEIETVEKAKTTV